MPQKSKKGRGNISRLPFGLRYYSGLGAGLGGRLKLRLKYNLAVVSTSLFSSIGSSGCQLKLQRLILLVRTRGNTHDLAIRGIQFHWTTRAIGRLGNGKVKLLRSIRRSLNIKFALGFIIGRFIRSINADMQGLIIINDVTRHANFRYIALSSRAVDSCRLILCVFIGYCFNDTSLAYACVSTKVDLFRDRPSIAAINLIGHHSVGTCCSVAALMRTHLRSSTSTRRKHRHCAHRNRQRRCKEQGGCVLRQFHNPYLAMGPVADGQPWICLLLSHHMVC